jgi:NADPH-dependent curcumin reductase CurA
MKVIASAGNNAKVEYIRSLGADFAFNYKTEGYTEPLSKYGPFDVYWVCFAGMLVISPSRSSSSGQCWRPGV